MVMVVMMGKVMAPVPVVVDFSLMEKMEPTEPLNLMVENHLLMA